jgi:hypothetical protein
MKNNGTKITVLDPRGQPSGIFGRTVPPDAPMMDLLDPFAQPEGSLELQHMAPRLTSLDGKTVYLVDTGFAGSYEFLEEAQGWFSRNRPVIKTVLKRKGGNAFSDAPQLWVELKEKADAVVFGVGG